MLITSIIVLLSRKNRKSNQLAKIKEFHDKGDNYEVNHENWQVPSNREACKEKQEIRNKNNFILIGGLEVTTIYNFSKKGVISKYSSVDNSQVGDTWVYKFEYVL